MKKIRKVFVVIFGFLCLFLFPITTKAWQTGSSSVGGGSTSGGGCIGWCSTADNPDPDTGKIRDSGVWFYEYVYQPKGGDASKRETEACAVVYTDPIYLDKEAVKAKAKKFAEEYRTPSGKHVKCEFIDKTHHAEGGLYDLSIRLHKKPLDEIEIVKEKSVATAYMSDFGKKISDFTKEGSEPGEAGGGINSYGYRVLIQRLTCFWTGADSVAQRKCEVLNLRKAMADDTDHFSQIIGDGYTQELHTTESDIGIEKAKYPAASGGRYLANWGNCGPNNAVSQKDSVFCNETGVRFADISKGEGYNIIGFHHSVLEDDKDYSLDMACTNCTSTNKTSKAIVLQDTTDWDAITNVDNITTCDSNKKDHITKHFKKGGVYCREEYHVFYPNANNKINVQLGRYFTVGANKTQLDIVDGTIPNLAPVKVTKIRECKGEENKLTTFKKKSDSEFKKCGGTVKVEYHDGTSKDIYKYVGSLTSRMSSFTSVIKNKKLTQQVVFNYSLPKGVYRYVRKSDGRSIHAKDIDKAERRNYTDLKIGNFPIPINNVDTKNLTVSFQYILPTCDSYSDMKTVYDGSKDNDYLLCSSNSTEQNVYNENDKDKLKNTACAKLYNSTTSNAFIKCKNARTSNKMGSCYAKNSGTGKDNYFCDELVNVKHVCEKVDDKYYDDKGNEVDEDTYKKKCGCTITDDGAYHDKDGKETTYEEYTKQCGECNKENHEKIFHQDWDDRPESEGGQKCCPEGSKYIDGYGCSNDIICNKDTVGKKIDEDHDYTGLSWTGKECVEPGKPYTCSSTTAGKKTDDYDYSDQEYIEDYGCCNKNDVYVKPDGGKACDTRPDPGKPEVCNINNYEEFGRSWNEADGECCPVGYTYIASLKKCEPITDCTTTPDDKCKPETKCDTEHLDCPKNTNNETACCENTSGIAYCGYIINNKVVCPGKPSVMSAVYRTIDPNNAFTSQNGETRQTGANWCSNILAKTSDPTCSGNATATTENSTVYNSIVARNSKNVDDSDAMYKVVLDSYIINEVRKYNKNKTYDDFTLKCTKGENCKSEFLKTVLNGASTKDGDRVLTVKVVK